MSLIKAHCDHRRAWEDFYYIYPVISRRSRGVSIGVNLNPDKVCNFDCVYCEVDRKAPPRVREIDLSVLAEELRAMLEIWSSGKLFERAPFDSVPPEWRRLNDIAFSGDGEPTTCPLFEDAVEVVYGLRNQIAAEAKLVLITDSACLDRPGVKAGLRRMQHGPHEVWAKLDAGTEEYYKRVNRSHVRYDRILSNISQTASWLPLMIQSLFFRIHGEPPSNEEIDAYCERIKFFQSNGAQILGLQLYTIARPTPEPWATSLTRDELNSIAERIYSRTKLPQQLAYGSLQ